MPLASWGGGSDPSSVFATLAAGVEDSIRAAAARLDDRRESELAAQDEEFYARYQAGKVSDDEWLDYIRRRRAETDYDPEQAAAWKKAELEWTEKIADDRAAAAFEKTRDYGDYIGYLEGKLKRTRDSSGRLEVTAQIRELRDAQFQQGLQQGAQRIQEKIAAGDATNDDLLRFYREKRRDMRSSSPLAQDLNDAIIETQAAVTAQRFESRLARIDHDLGTGDITTVEAGRRKRDLLDGSDLLQTDPGRYFTLLTDAETLMHTPTEAEITGLFFKLQTGQITAAEYEAGMYQFANRLNPYDPAGAATLRNEAYGTIKQWTSGRLSDPGEIRVGPGGIEGFKWQSQMDGSALQNLNCTMASGAMLAYAMGYKGLSGGDLRYLTGDLEGGTTVVQLYDALNRAGVDTGDMALVQGGSFERFKKMVGNGRSSVIVGDNSAIPASAKANPNHMGLHSWLVADYDESKDAFLVYNSAMGRGDKRSKDGYWVSANVMESFAFGPRTSGSWVAAPRGTARAAGGKRRAWHVIDVDTPPQRKGTPRNYVGLRNPGMSGAQRGALSGSANTDEYKGMIERRKKEIDQANAVIEAFERGDKEYADQPIDEAVIDAIDDDTLDLYDEAIAFARDNEDSENVIDLRKGRMDLVTGARQRNGAKTLSLLGTLIRDSSGLLELSQFQTDPEARGAIVDLINGKFSAFQAATGGKQGDSNRAKLTQNDEMTQGVVDTIVAGIATAADPNADLNTKRKAIEDVTEALKETGVTAVLPTGFIEGKGQGDGNDLGKVLATGAGLSDDARAVRDGEKMMVAIPHFDEATKTWVSRSEAVPVTGEVVTRLDGNGNPVEIPVPDLSEYADLNKDFSSLGWAFVRGSNGKTTVMPVASWTEPSYPSFKAAQDDPTGKDRFDKGQVLDQATLNKLSPRERKILLDRGVLEQNDLPVTRMVTPGAMTPDGYAPGRMFVRDDGSGPDTGTGRWYPERLPIGVGDAILGLTDVVGVKPDGKLDVTPPTVNGFEIVPGGGVNLNEVKRIWESGAAEPYRIPVAERQYRDEGGALVRDEFYDPGSAIYGAPVDLAVAKARENADQWRSRVERLQQDRITAALAAGQQAERAAQDASIFAQSQQSGYGVPGQVSFDSGAVAKQVMDLAGRFGVKTPAQQEKQRPVNPVADRTALDRAINRPQTRALPEPKRPEPSPSRGDIPAPARLPDRVPERKEAKKRFIPPPPPVVRSAQKAQANKAIADAKAAAARAAAARKTYVPPTGGGIFRRY